MMTEHDFSITPEQEAWFKAQVELVRRLAADEEPDDAPQAPIGAPLLFLDLDGVVCASNAFGGYDALQCVTAKRIDTHIVYASLFASDSVTALRRIHDAMGGQLRYIISSTWRELFTRAQLRHVFRQAGLDFVADCMEDKVRWRTPIYMEPNRLREVSNWLDKHHAGEPFVIIDDEYSGHTLARAARHDGELAGRLVLCDESIGLHAQHVDAAVAALQRKPT